MGSAMQRELGVRYLADEGGVEVGILLTWV